MLIKNEKVKKEFDDELFTYLKKKFLNKMSKKLKND
jgi:hypothetical protein